MYLLACSYICTFIYRGACHVIETQCGVDIIDILEEGEEVLHFFKRDALWEREMEDAKINCITKAIHLVQLFYDTSGHSARLVKTAERVKWH